MYWTTRLPAPRSPGRERSAFFSPLLAGSILVSLAILGVAWSPVLAGEASRHPIRPVLGADGVTVVEVIPRSIDTGHGVVPVDLTGLDWAGTIPTGDAGTSAGQASESMTGGFRRATWQLQSTSSAVFTDLSMAGAAHGFASAELGQVYRTIDGTTWTSVLNQGFPYYWYGVHAFDPTTVFITGFNNSSGEGVARWSYDGGVSWTPVMAIDPGGWLTINQFADRNHGITTNIGGGTTFFTMNGGANPADWTEVLADPSGGWFAGNFTFQPDNLFVYLCGISFCRSRNGGIFYTCRTSVDPVFDGGVSFPDTTHGWTGGGQISTPVQGWVHRTTDGGETWTGRILNPPYPVRVVLFLDELVGFAAGGNYFQSIGGIWSTVDGGVSWNLDLSTGTEMKGIDWVRVSPDSVDVWCAGSAPGVGKIYHTRIHLPGSVISIAEATPPTNGIGLVASPNPFNPSVRFSISTERDLRKARLVIMDIQGRRVRELGVGDLRPGRTVIIWDGRDQSGRTIASGTYHYRLVHAQGASAASGIVLLK